MVLSDEKVREYKMRLLLSRMRILVENGFYGLLLMHMTYTLDESISTAATDGNKIYFCPEFLEELSDKELDFVMMHEILHVVLQHCLRREKRDPERFNIACDIVVNSNILLSNGMDISSISLKKYGALMHTAPDGKEGHLYTAEQVYDMLVPETGSGSGQHGRGGDIGKSGGNPGTGTESGQGKIGSGSANGKGKSKGGKTWDDHSRWGTVDDEALRDVWVKRFADACKAIEVRDPSETRGLLPAFAKRILKELTKPQTDWRTVLNDFVQEEVVDYSFTPPDRRFDGPFFLPDFNEKDETVENILFMIDTSGSMSDSMITAAYSEVKGAIDQFGGKLKGLLGFFDAAIVEPRPFENEDEFKVIKPVGGGGTSFDIIFDYVAKFMDEPPVSIIILTDGYAPFPPEEKAGGIPVLWIINNEQITPPWGKVTRIN